MNGAIPFNHWSRNPGMYTSKKFGTPQGRLTPLSAAPAPTAPAAPPSLKTNKDARNAFADLIRQMLGGANIDAQGLAGLSQARKGAAMGAFKSLSPGAAQASIDARRAQLSSQANQQARSAGLALGPAATGLKSGLNLQALNQARTMGNDYQTQMFSPEAIAQRQLMQMQALDPQNFTTTLQMILPQLAQLSGMNPQQPKSATLLESLMGIGGKIAGGLDFNKIFGI